MKNQSALRLMLAFCSSLLLLGSVSQANAMNCPDISGTYSSDEGFKFGYQQTSCTTLTRMIGVKDTNGQIQFAVDRVFSLDGTPICNAYHACEVVRASQRSIDFELNFDGAVRTDDHGRCTQRGYSLKKNSDGNLLALFSVYRCADGFKGQVPVVFQKN